MADQKGREKQDNREEKRREQGSTQRYRPGAILDNRKADEWIGALHACRVSTLFGRSKRKGQDMCINRDSASAIPSTIDSGGRMKGRPFSDAVDRETAVVLLLTRPIWCCYCGPLTPLIVLAPASCDTSLPSLGINNTPCHIVCIPFLSLWCMCVLPPHYLPERDMAHILLLRTNAFNSWDDEMDIQHRTVSGRLTPYQEPCNELPQQWFMQALCTCRSNRYIIIKVSFSKAYPVSNPL